jgi:T4 RnlA family RNA ligase
MIEKLDGFTYKEGTIAGDAVWLVTPDDITTKWNSDTLKYRSVIMRQSDGKIISSGFKKFFNFNEKPDLDPWLSSFKVQATTKKDGSLLIVSKYKDELIVRTRGTFSAKQMLNGFEIDFLMEKYPFVFDNVLLSNNKSVLLEWTTPNNIIVLRESNEPKLWLIGVIDHDTGRYYTKEELDALAIVLCVDRPKHFSYNSLFECFEDVNLWKDQEGVVLYSEDGQILKKVKAEHYLTLHKLKSSIASLGNLLDVYLTSTNRGDYNSFYEFIETTMDYELAEACKDNMLKITQTNMEILAEIEEAKQFVSALKGVTRKDNAVAICQRYTDWRKGLCFNLLDGKSNIREKANLTDVFMYKMK